MICKKLKTPPVLYSVMATIIIIFSIIEILSRFYFSVMFCNLLGFVRFCIGFAFILTTFILITITFFEYKKGLKEKLSYNLSLITAAKRLVHIFKILVLSSTMLILLGFTNVNSANVSPKSATWGTGLGMLIVSGCIWIIALMTTIHINFNWANINLNSENKHMVGQIMNNYLRTIIFRVRSWRLKIIEIVHNNALTVYMCGKNKIIEEKVNWNITQELLVVEKKNNPPKQ
ncbi:hypothetical protein SCHIN_v1c01700 [Spiroplasma chinense]|uniref:Transmembrane protein n=1 Tax=Spiroplasma chinense TaxID=216932 RepID=A0A5B9Y2U1_9MOLU|nr:hypothetical protein [Spiroplasma chinense]QEH61368.1 hypothetical protein SCHIN_v1c01700 [Spiroplasma chinense]